LRSQLSASEVTLVVVPATSSDTPNESTQLEQVQTYLLSWLDSR